jgi:hypothetical protein
LLEHYFTLLTIGIARNHRHQDAVFRATHAGQGICHLEGSMGGQGIRRAGDDNQVNRAIDEIDFLPFHARLGIEDQVFELARHPDRLALAGDRKRQFAAEKAIARVVALCTLAVPTEGRNLQGLGRRINGSHLYLFRKGR